MALVTLMSDARWRDTHWSWESKDGNDRVGYQGLDGRVSIAELIEHMREVAPHASLDEIMLNYATVKWTQPATAEELAERDGWKRRQRERTEEWERTTYARLKEKYADE